MNHFLNPKTITHCPNKYKYKLHKVFKKQNKSKNHIKILTKIIKLKT